ncbi:TPR repeat protein [Sinorhizobium fredii]
MMRRSLRIGLARAILLLSMPILPGVSGDVSGDELPTGALTANFPADEAQPALGRTLSELADLYIARRIDRTTVERQLGEYQQMLRQAGADALLAVSAPSPLAGTVADLPDGRLALNLYERAITLGDSGALIGVGNLYLRGQFLEGAPEPERAFEAYARAAAQGNLEGKLRVAELQIRGEGTERDIVAGFTALQELTRADDARVLQALAGLCLSGRIAVRSDLALTALERAAAIFGSAEAYLRLGDLYSRGEDVPADYFLAIEHYRRAAAKGSIDATVKIAEMQARGQGTRKDVIGALAELHDLGRSGEARALLALGDHYGTGEVVPIEASLARNYYESAAGKGSTTALLRLGDGYRKGLFGSRNLAKAADSYRKAWEAGNRGAAIALGVLEASAGRKRIAANGTARLRRAANEGVDGAAVALADAMFYGYGTARDPSGALSLLEEARSKGDRQALLALVAAYRDGKQDGKERLVRKAPRKAKALLTASIEMLPVPARNVQQFLFAAATAKTRAFADLNQRLSALSQPERRQIVRDLPKVNSGLFAYVVKARLKELGARIGRIDGRFNRSFIRAVVKYCRATASNRRCNRGPRNPEVVEIVSYAF